MLVERSGVSDRTTTTSYWPSSAPRRVVRPNGTQQDTDYDTQGRVRQIDRTPGTSGASPRGHDYFYDNVGNRTHDDEGRYDFNARDQLINWTRKRDTGDPKNSTTVSYEITGSGAMHERTDGSTSLTFDLKGDQIDHAKALAGTTSTRLEFGYDGATGAMTCSGATTLSTCAGGTKYDYDGFGRLKQADNVGSGGAKASYAYDGLDRPDSTCTETTSSGGCSTDHQDEYG